jgi:hypothetical protein
VTLLTDATARQSYGSGPQAGGGLLTMDVADMARQSALLSQWQRCGTSERIRTMKAFNRSAAANYAIKYSQQYNPEWPRYDNEDCTNFVSQALYAGGWTMISRGTILGSRRDRGSWYSQQAESGGAREHSWTWSNVNAFAQFLTISNRAKRCQIGDLALGDVVQLKDYDIIHHTMIVTGVLNGPFVTYHTNDVTNKPLAKISAQEVMCWKILDQFDENVTFVMPRVS